MTPPPGRDGAAGRPASLPPPAPSAAASAGAALALALLAACGGPEAGEEEREGDEAPASDSVVTIHTSALELAGLTEVAPRPGRLARTATLVGRLEVDPARRSAVRAPAAGRFELGVAPGDRVAGGEPVGWIESPETYPDSLPLAAPTGGRVLDLPSGRAGLVEAWAPLAVVASTDTLRLVLPLPPERYADVREGTALSVAPGEGPAGGAPIRARVDGFTGPTGEAAPLRATARVPNPAGRLAPGMRVPVAVALGDSLSGHWLPDASVLYDRRRPDLTVAFVRRGDGFVRVPVEVGARTGDSVFVTAGLDDRDSVVAEGSYQLLYADFSFRGIGAEAGEMEEGEEGDGGP